MLSNHFLVDALVENLIELLPFFLFFLFLNSGVALVLCQSDPVLNDGHSGEQSRDAVLDGVRKKFLERVVREREDDDDGSSSD